MLQNLPYKVRYCRTAGSPAKSIFNYRRHVFEPNMAKNAHFLKPFAKSLKMLATQGFNWVHPIHKTDINSKVLTTIVSVYSVAGAKLQNINQFIGDHGCSMCEQTGVEIEAKKCYIYKPKFLAKLRQNRRMQEQTEQ